MWRVSLNTFPGITSHISPPLKTFLVPGWREERMRWRLVISAWRTMEVLAGACASAVGWQALGLWGAVSSQRSSREGFVTPEAQTLMQIPNTQVCACRLHHPSVHPASSAGWCKGKWINGLALFSSFGVTWEARREQICSHDKTCPLSTLHEIATSHS